MRRFLRSRHGGASAELVFVAVPFFVFVFGLIDLGRMAFDLHMGATAAQQGARFAVVNDYAAVEYGSFSGIDQVPFIPNGDPIPLDAIATAVCDADGCTAICEADGGCGVASFTFDSDAYASIVGAMRGWYPTVVAPETRVAVTYKHIGLGFSGNPNRPSDLVPLVTVRIENASFDFATPGIPTITLPGFTTTLTAEDGWTP